MLLGQMGLSADQKAIIRDLENINMAVMKTMATIKDATISFSFY